MRYPTALRAALVIGLSLNGAAHAEERATAFASDSRPFAQEPVSESLLSGARGGSGPFASLTRATAYHIVDEAARSDLRMSGSLGRIEMDVWWGAIGSELIAVNVRSSRE